MSHRWMRRLAPACALIGTALLLADCAETTLVAHVAKELAGTTTPASPRGVYKVGEPYQIDGVWYQPQEDFAYDRTGIASWYGPDFHGQVTANGEVFDQEALTAAHPTLSMPSLAKVTNLENGRSVVVRINDRGPFVRGRFIDVSRQTARLLGFEAKGTAKVRVTVLGAESRQLKRQTLARAGGRQVARADPPPPVADPAPVAVPPQPVSAQEQQWRQLISQQPVTPSNIYVQAGAFTVYDNAERLRAGLDHLGPLAVTPALVGGKRFYRVRLGPVHAVERADTLLASVIAAGHPQAEIVVE